MSGRHAKRLGNHGQCHARPHFLRLCRSSGRRVANCVAESPSDGETLVAVVGTLTGGQGTAGSTR